MTGLLEDASFNQSPAFGDVDLFSSDRPLAEAAARYKLDSKALSVCGKDFGSAETLDLGRLANEFPPKLRTMDAKGNRLDQVEFHPAYHALMSKSIGYGIHSSAHDGSEPAGPMTSRAMRLYLANEAESGHLCPITMTHASVGALRAEPTLLANWLPKIVSRHYDPRPLPWWEKTGVTIGMGMTERQGGTDVRANITEATPHGDHVEITGHKWFMSAPMCDAFLVLAQAQRGLTCFFLPRILADGRVNALRIERLKDKLGNKANASSEVEFTGARAWTVGEEGRGVPTILEMGTLTRLDCALGTAGLMRQALALALHHAARRQAFGKLLREQPIMKNVLADLALESEAATALALRLARAFDGWQDARESLLRRVLTPIAKFWICKRGSHFAQEAMECLGGNGYVEEDGAGPMARPG